jgi:hypothetical protein
MENFELENLNGVELTYSFEKYDDGTITIRIENGKPILTVLDIGVFSKRTTENFNKISKLKNFVFKPNESFQVYPDMVDDENEHFGQIFFEGNSLDNYYFQDIYSPIKEKLIEKGVIKRRTFFGDVQEVTGEVLKGGGVLYYNIFWEAFKKAVFSDSLDSQTTEIKEEVVERSPRKPVWKGIRTSEVGDVWEILPLEYQAGSLYCKEVDENGEFEVSGSITKSKIILVKKYVSGKVIKFEADSTDDGTFFEGHWTSNEESGKFEMFKPFAVELD